MQPVLKIFSDNSSLKQQWREMRAPHAAALARMVREGAVRTDLMRAAAAG